MPNYIDYAEIAANHAADLAAEYDIDYTEIIELLAA